MADTVTIKVNSQDNTSADFDALKARLEALKAQRAAISVDFDDKDATARLAIIDAKIKIIGEKVASPKISVTGAARAEADIAGVDLAMQRLDRTVKPKVDSSDVEHASTMTGLLVTGAAALGPAFAVAAVGAGVFGAAAIPALMNASKASSPLHSGLVELKGDYSKLTASVQPEVVTDFADAVTAAKNVIPEFTGVAQAGGKAVGGLITDFGQFAQSAGVKQFLAFVQAQAGPDMKAGVQAITGLAQGALGLVEALNPLGKLILPLVGDLGDFIADVSKGAPLLVQFGVGAAGVALGINKLAAGAKAISESTVGAALANWGSEALAATKGIEEAATAEKAMAVASAALDAVDPLVWVAAGVAALGGLAFLLVKTNQGTQDLTASMAAADHASGDNIAGYQKLSDQLSGVSGKQVAWKQAVDNTKISLGSARLGSDEYSQAASQVSAAQKDAATKADYLRLTLQSQATQMGLSVTAVSNVDLGMQTFGSHTQTTARQVAGLDLAWDTLTGDLFGKQQALLTSQQNVADYAQAVQASGTESQAAKSAASQLAGELETAGVKASDAKTEVGAYTLAIQNNGANSDAAKSARASLIADLVKSGVSAANAQTFVDDYTTAVSSSGTQSLQAKQAFLTAAAGIQTLADSLAKSHVPASTLYQDIENQITALRNAGPLNAQEKTDLAALEKAATLVGNSTKGMTDDQKASAKVMEGQLIPQLKALGLNSATARTDTDNLTTAIFNTGTKSNATKSDRQQLINDLKGAGLSAQAATILVDGYIKKLGQIPKSKTTDIVVHGDGSFSVSGGTGLTGKAAGGLISGGTAGRDSVLAALMPGEVVVPTSMVAAGAVDHLRGKLPGFAAGGVVGSYHGGVPGEPPWVSSEDAKVSNVMQQIVIDDLKAAAAKARAAAAQAAADVKGGVSGNVSSYAGDIAAVLTQLHEPAGDIGPVEHRMQQESGGNPTIVNLSDSNAAAGHPSVGLMQVIRGTFQRWAGPYLSRGPFEYGVSVDPIANIYAGLNYAKNSYSKPLADVMLQPGGYAGGGATSAGWKLAGEHGRELVRLPGGASVIPNGQSEAMLSAAGAGPTVIHLTIDSSGSPVDDSLLQILRKAIRVRGGNAQVVLGSGS